MKKILFLMGAVLLSSSAQAGLYLEPYVGYGFGTNKGSASYTSGGTPGTLTIDDKISGSSFGGKVGYSLLGFVVGADYQSNKMKTVDKSSNGNADETNTWTGTGLFAQFSLPIMFKFSATYFLKTKVKSETTESEGKGFKVGVGFTGLPFVSINLDMVNINFDKASGSDSSTTITGVDTKGKMTMLSVSLPFDL